ncbi:MAG: LysR family transcriptional regulator [Opitutaceae bacterium]|jgi:molybdate transport system regulatory protein
MPTPARTNLLQIAPGLRLNSGRGFAFGPGKAELLEHIAATGSIREAASAMEMSYMRAWTIVRSLEKAFPEPLVIKTRGGSSGGGARVTETGLEVLRLYREMEAYARKAIAVPAARLQSLLDGKA